MKNSAQQFSVWTPRRFLGVVALLFVLQAGLVLLFGARGTAPVSSAVSVTKFRSLGQTLTEEQLRRLFFASDPSVFVLPSAHGFSGRAWMDQSPPQYQPTNQLEAPRWLALNMARLRTGSGIFDDSDATAPLIADPEQNPQLEPLPSFLSPVEIPTQPSLLIEGDLAKRFIGPMPPLQSWPTPGKKLLTNSVVQIAVSPAGDVLAARLLNRCGAPEADVDAVAKASALRFRPVKDPKTTWAQAVFRWQTTFPAPPGAQQ